MNFILNVSKLCMPSDKYKLEHYKHEAHTLINGFTLASMWGSQQVSEKVAFEHCEYSHHIQGQVI